MIREVLAWLFTRRRPGARGPRIRLKIPRVQNLGELKVADPPAWLRTHVKRAGELEQRQAIALVVCPHGHRFAIAGSHTVDGWGNVEPKVSCPVDCTWSAFIELEKWEPL